MGDYPSTPQRPVAPQELDGERVSREHALYGIVWCNDQRMSGVPCFYGTRVPVKHLFDYLGSGLTLDEFLGDFPGVTREQAEAVLKNAGEAFRGHAA